MSHKYSWSEQELSNAVANTVSASACLRMLNIKPVGSNFTKLKSRITEFNIDNSHWFGKKNFKIGSNVNVDISKWLVVQSTVHRSYLKRAILNHNLLSYICSLCGLGPEWNGMELVLQIDHINGVKNDNRLENLRILCPNCHTQTETFVGRKFSKGVRHCIDCNKMIAHKSQRCIPCNNLLPNKERNRVF